MKRTLYRCFGAQAPLHLLSRSQLNDAIWVLEDGGELMASSDATQRAVLAGLSCGIGLAAPVVVYAATLPFSSINETVVAGAVPFAVGAVAGVGIYAASLGISEYRAEHDGRLFEPDAVGGAAQFSRTYNEFKTASIPVQQEETAPRAAAPVTLDEQGQSSSLLSGLTGAF